MLSELKGGKNKKNFFFLRHIHVSKYTLFIYFSLHNNYNLNFFYYKNVIRESKCLFVSLDNMTLEVTRANIILNVGLTSDVIRAFYVCLFKIVCSYINVYFCCVRRVFQSKVFSSRLKNKVFDVNCLKLVIAEEGF